ncbi:sensor histidine kinase [Monashia sp. NPDC004114]
MTRSTDTKADPVARAARSIATRIGITTAVVVLLAILGAGILFDRQQATEIRRQVIAAAQTVDDVGDAPPGIWLVEVTPSGANATPGTPPSIVAAVQTAVDREAGRDGSAGTTAASGGSGGSGGTTGAPGGGGSASGGATASGSSEPRMISVISDGRDWPTAGVERHGTTFAAVYDIRLHQQQERNLLLSMAVAGLLGVALSAVVGLLAARRAVRPLAEALELQRQFVADASHELRTPLSVISIRAQMLRRRLRASGRDEEAQEVEQLVADTKVMSDVVSDLLLSAQLDATEATKDAVNLVHVAEQVGQSLEPYAAESGVTLAWPNAAHRRPVVVDGVASSLRRAVLALADNAIAHSPDGSRVELRVEARGREAVVDVADQGSGVDAADLSHLTRRFARAKDDGAGRRFGLGLALVTQIVRSHGGTLAVDQTPGGGATFSLHLPLAEDGEDE